MNAERNPAYAACGIVKARIRRFGLSKKALDDYSSRCVDGNGFPFNILRKTFTSSPENSCPASIDLPTAMLF